MTQHFEGYAARFAKPEEARAVYDFYASDPDKRRQAVYLRHRKLIYDQVRKGLFFTIWQGDKIVGASTIYQLADGKDIDCIVNGDYVEKGTVVELGSVLRWGDSLNANKRTPKKFFHPLLFAIPMLEAFRRAGNELTVNLLVANVQSRKELKETTDRLTGELKPTPHRWKEIMPATGLIDAFEDTTDDPNAQMPKRYYRAQARNLPRVAEYVLNAAQEGILRNGRKDTLAIDMSDLPLADYQNIVTCKEEFRNTDPNISWNEAARLFPTWMGNHLEPPVPQADTAAVPGCNLT